MARLVVRNRDKVNPDAVASDFMCMKRGMVVDILLDGMSLGRVGDSYPGWTVVEVPGVEPMYLMDFLRKGKERAGRRDCLFDLNAYKKLGKSRLTLVEALNLRRGL